MDLRVILYGLLGGFFLFFFSSCEKLKTKIDNPGYIKIPSYKVFYKNSYANGGPGTTNHKFTDVKVSVNGDVFGVFPIPCTVPVPEVGSSNIVITPIIKVNGVSTVRSEYAPMRIFDTTLTIEAGKATEIIPTFDYYETGVTFYWVEDFEVSGSSLIGDTAIKLQTVEKFEGAKAVKIELRNGQSTSLSYSSSQLPLPHNSEMLYLEVNYKCNQSFEVGLLDANKNPLGAAGGANPSAEWNKIYLFLTPVASRSPLPAYHVYFYFTNSSFSDNGLGPNPILYIDNIKVVSQP